MSCARSVLFIASVLSFFPACTFFAQRKVDDVMVNKPYATALPSVLDSAGKLNQDLVALLGLLEILHDGSLADVVEKTQAQWLRQAGKERWEVSSRVIKDQDFFLSLLGNLGFIAEVAPEQQQYDYAVLLGATLEAFRNRLHYLITLWQQGVRFNKVVLLGGQRSLEKDFEGKGALLDRTNAYLPIRSDWQLTGELPTTEMQMMMLVYEQAVMPESMRKVPLVMVDSPMRQRPDGSLARPTTVDTVNDWLQTKPVPGSCLVISNQPFVQYQHSVVKTPLPGEFFVETVGHAAQVKYHNNPVKGDTVDRYNAVYLDTMARWLYQEKKRLGR